MAERIAYLEAVIGADITSFRRGMRDVRNETNLLSETVGGIAGVARTLTYAVSAPLFALGTGAVSAASRFDEEMRNINSIAHLSEEVFASLGERVLEFGSNTRAGATGAAEALYSIYSAGLTNLEDAFSLMEVSVRTAEAGLADLTVTTETLTAILLTYGDTSEDAAWRASNALTAMVQIGVGSMQDFAGAIPTFLGAARSLGISVEDVFATEAFLTQRGMNAARAGTSLNAILTDLITPTDELTAVFQQLGVSSGQDLIAQFGGLYGALEAIFSVVGTAPEDIAGVFDNERSRRGINLLVTAMEAYGISVRDFYEMVGEDTTMTAWGEQMQSFAAQWDLLKSALQGAAITIGQQIIPVITPLVTGLTGVLQRVVQSNPALVQFGVILGMVATAAFPLTWLFTSLVSPFGIFAGLLGGVISLLSGGGIGTAVANLAGFEEAGQGVLGAVQLLRDAIGLFFNVLQYEAPSMLAGVPPMVMSASDFVTITVSEGDTLWDLWFESYQEEFPTFNEFLERVWADNPWMNRGTVIIPGQTITLNFNDVALTTNPDAMRMMGGWEMGTSEYFEESITPDNSFGARLARAVEIALPVIQATIQNVFEQAFNWFTTTALPAMGDFGAGILNRIASWFTPSGAAGGRTPIAVALEYLLQGDITAALNTIIPGLGDKMSELFGQLDLSAALGGLGTAFVNLIGSFANWIVTDGIPTVARSLGYAIGYLGTEIVQMFSDAIDWIFNRGGAAEIGDAAGTFFEGVGTQVVEPFSEGMSDGMAAASDGQDLNFVETFFSAIAGALAVGAGVFFLGQLAMHGVGAAIVGTIGLAIRAASFIGGGLISVAGSILSTLAQSFNFVGAANSFIGAIWSFGSWVASSVGNAIAGAFGISGGFGGIISNIGTRIGVWLIDAQQFVGAGISALGNFIGSGIVASIAGAIGLLLPLAIGAALFLVAADPITQEAMSGISVVSQASGFTTGEHLGFLAEEGYVIGTQWSTGFLTGIDEGLGRSYGIGDAYNLLSAQGFDVEIRVTQAQADSILADWAQTNPGAAFPFPMTIVPTVEESGLFDRETGQMLYGTLLPESLMPEVELETPEFYGSPLEAALSRLVEQAAAFMAQTPPIDMSNWVITPREDFLADALPDVNIVMEGWSDELLEYVNGLIDELIAAIGARDWGRVAEITGTLINTLGLDSFTLVMEQMLEQAAAQNPVFAQNALTMLGEMMYTYFQGVGTFAGMTEEQIHDVTNTWITSMNSIITVAADGVNPAVTFDLAPVPNIDVARFIADVNQVVTNALLGFTASVPISPMLTGLPGHAAGLDRVPYDNYVARLHEGERVLTAEQADAMDARGALTSGRGVPVNQSSSTVIQVYGIRDVDMLVGELRRRGYNLPR